jgi:hypothetical protein
MWQGPSIVLAQAHFDCALYINPFGLVERNLLVEKVGRAMAQNAEPGAFAITGEHFGHKVLL